MEITKENLTLIFSGIAAAIGVVSFLWNWLDRRDSIYVGFGSLRPDMTPLQGMYVINLSKHSVELRDFGLIFEDGTLCSLPMCFNEIWEFQGDSCPPYEIGDRCLAPRGTLRAGLMLGRKSVGAYAITATRSSINTRICNGRWYRKIWIWFKTRFSTEYA